MYTEALYEEEYADMNGQELEQKVLQSEEDRAFSAVERAEDGLAILLERFPDYFRGRAEWDDIETLVFCLRHLFNCMNTLYQQTLPALKRSTSTQSMPSHGTFAHQHAIWVQLQAILLLIERIESHCHLLLSITTSVLATLDSTEETACSTEVLTHVGTEQWQYVYEVLSSALNAWQEYNTASLSFATVFAKALPALPIAPLIAMDTALALLFDSANAIFGDIIPDIQLVAQGDDEVVATLLFDLMQQKDLLLIQIGKLVEPVQLLIKQYAVKE